MEYLIPEVCRICERTSLLEPLFDKKHFIVLRKLRHIVDVSIEWTDLLPKFICIKCLRHLENAYQFKIQCETVDRKFRDIIEQALNTVTETKIESKNKTDDRIYQVENLSDNYGNPNVHTNIIIYEDRSSIDYLDDIPNEIEEFNQECNNDDVEIFEKNSQLVNGETASEMNYLKKISYICTTCNAEYDLKQLFKDQSEFRGNNYYLCPICDKRLTQTYKGTANLFSCSLCAKKYTSQTNLGRHVRVIHEKEKKYKCELCEKSFSQSATLRTHQAVHTSERKFVCNYCDKKFKLKEHLRSHQLRHLPKSEQPVRKYKSQIKKYKPKLKTCVCTVCGKISKTRALHISHMKTHSQEKPYECKLCEKKFSFLQSLRNHSYIHTGEKKFHCDTCEMSFRQIGHLKVHELTHTKEKRHECDTCFKKFSTRSNLTVHQRKHSGYTPYYCIDCPKKFYDPNGLKRHRPIHEKQRKRAQENEIKQK